MATENIKTLNTRIQHKHDIEVNWNKASSFIPKVGEIIIYDADSAHTYARIKIGDGETAVTALPFYGDNFAASENLLNNWYWLDPVNSRGQTVYTGVYSIDNWWCGSTACSWELTDKGLKITNTSTSNSVYIRQRTENGYPDGEYIVSALVTEVTGDTKPSLYLSNDSGNAINNGLIRMSATGLYSISKSVTGFDRVQITMPVGSSITIAAIKLERGSVQTLARQDSDGNWIINDLPPDKHMEMLKCIQSTAVTSDTYANHAVYHTGNKPNAEDIGALAENAEVCDDCDTEIKAGGQKTTLKKLIADSANSPNKAGLTSYTQGIILTYAYSTAHGIQYAFLGGTIFVRNYANSSIGVWRQVASTDKVLLLDGSNAMTGDLTFQKVDNGKAMILKNHSSSVDGGLSLRDFDSNGASAYVEIRAAEQRAVLRLGGATNEILHTGNFADYAYSLNTATAIPNDSDLNDYTTFGNYYASSNQTPTLTNIPTDLGSNGFILHVERCTYSTTNYCKQRIVSYNGSAEYWRVNRNGTWSEWAEIKGNLSAADVGAVALDGSNAMTGNLSIVKTTPIARLRDSTNNSEMTLFNANHRAYMQAMNDYTSDDNRRQLVLADSNVATLDKSLYIQDIVADNLTAYEVYHEGNKPTAADVGALAVIGNENLPAYGLDVATSTLEDICQKIPERSQYINSWVGTATGTSPLCGEMPCAYGVLTITKSTVNAAVVEFHWYDESPSYNLGTYIRKWSWVNNTYILSDWGRVFTSANKPTAADVGVSFTAAKTSGTKIGTITLDGVATNIYCNTGDITGVTAGNGLTGGATSGNATLNVGAGTGITVNDNDVALATYGTAATYGPSANATLSHSGTFTVPKITTDAYGRVTASNITYKLPASGNTDTKVNMKARGTTKAYLLASTTAPTSSNQAITSVAETGVYLDTTAGKLVATSVYGAVWNDYAEYRESDIIEPGRVICENGDDTLSLATERLQPGANVISDTFGFAIGETETAKTPIAVSGRVLVYPYEDRDTYKPGDAVCAAPNGTVSKMTREEIREYPERIIGTVSAIPNYETWGTGNVPVNGRIWIKVK